MVVLPVGLILAGAAAAFVVATYEPDYEASALIMIEDTAQHVAFVEGTTSRSFSYVQTQIELLRSPLVLMPLLSDPKIASIPEIEKSSDKVATLKRRLQIQRIGQSELYNVAYRSKSPTEAMDVANAIVIQYLQIQQASEKERTDRVVELLERERLARRTVVERLQKEVQKLGEVITGHDPFFNSRTTNIDIASNPAFNTYNQLTQLDLQIIELNANIQSLEEGSASELGDAQTASVASLQVTRDAEVQQRKEAISGLQATMADFRTTMLDGKWKNDPFYKGLLQKLKDEQLALKELEETKKEVYLEEAAKNRETENEWNRIQLQRKLELVKRQKEKLEEKLATEMELQKSSGSEIVEFQFKAAELKREEKIFELIASRSLAIQTESRAPARVTLKQEAMRPLLPVNRVPYKILFLACSAALLAPFGLAVLREISICRISDVEQLSREGMRPVIGEVSHFPIRRVAANPQLLPAKLRRQMFLYLESVDSLRTNIALSEQGKDKQLIVITSAAAGEGKTCLSTSLAMSTARADKKPTLVIDGDLRSPDVASVLAIRERPGLAELLTNEASLADVIQRVGKTNAFVIPAGRFKGNPHHIINEARLKPILDRLRTQFSTIILDTPPIFGGSESLVFARMADAVVVSVLSDVSRSRQLNGALDRLDRAGANVIGVVLNGTSTQSYAYAYGYGYYSGRLEAIEA
jgi:capsular exopolysaccharide synthesis family protein